MYYWGVGNYIRVREGNHMEYIENKMDDTSKLKIMVFFDTLRNEMNNLNDPKLPEMMHRLEQRGYFMAVEKMNFFIQEFIKNEIKENDGK